MLIKKSNKHFYTYMIISNRISFSFSTNSKLFRNNLKINLSYKPKKYRKIYIYSCILTKIISSRNIKYLSFKCEYPFKSRVKFLYNFLMSNFNIIN
ncbi:hypothetical protein JSR06_00730 [Candidatus Vidania fulgoroideae]|uniref:Uncharacterized protein n=1 Tax=Candidatus Vidania fulgoroideorum TaxID=881286 RepID=A0A974XAG5_9PROT|nr:hypothetical protein JSR06_00730 [Candidatus Vidania fulgoroideae]